jgi:sarcosine oxidase gamma subunit
VLEFTRAPAAVIACLARAEALDAVPADGAYACRVAPDELLLVGPHSARGELEQAAAERLVELDPDALVVDQSDGWAAWTLEGEDRDEAFARLSAVPLPDTRPAFLQGAVAGVQGKVIASPRRTHVLVVSTVGHHVRRRLLAACADLEVSEGVPAELAAKGAVGVPGSAGGTQ